MKEEFAASCKDSIYQKAEKVDFSFWYGENGIMKQMLQEARKENSEIMKFPIIEEEELVTTINNMRNGKAAGIYGIKSELMKYIIMDEEIKKYTTKCYNSILKEKTHEDWLESVTTMIPKEKSLKYQNIDQQLLL